MANNTIEKVLVEFDAIMDIDMGLVRMIREKYNTPNIMKQELLNADEPIILESLVYRTKINPLYLCLKSEYHDQADRLYKEMMETDYDRILELTTPTALANVVYNLIRTPNETIECTVLCKNEKQKQLIKAYDDKMNVIISDDYNIDVTKYTSLFIKSLGSLLSYSNVKNKNIYVARLIQNMQSIMGEYVVNIGAVIALGYSNKFVLIDYYPNMIPAYAEETKEKG